MRYLAGSLRGRQLIYQIGSPSRWRKLLFPAFFAHGRFLSPRTGKGILMPTTTSVRNYWPDTKCARAFWSQRELPPYRKLLADTTAWLDPKAGERWLDLGCGSGQLTRAVWETSSGAVAEVVALDCAAKNERSIARVRRKVQPAPVPTQMRFVHGDFSHGLDRWEDGHFDGAVSGL